MGQLTGPTDPAADAGWAGLPSRARASSPTPRSASAARPAKWPARSGTATRATATSNCSGSSYDNTGALGASTWRHVAFIEQGRDRIEEARESGRALVSLGMPVPAARHRRRCRHDPKPPDTPEFRWLMSSDVCKHCTHAGCLDVCPTGALFRTEFGTVVVQDDVCNGCGTCVAGCPFGVVERRSDGTYATPAQRPGRPAEKFVTGVAQKCTLCYDRLVEDQIPACAQTCPTTSIKFGDHDDLVGMARERVAQLHAEGRTEARLYGANEHDGVGGIGSVFLLLDEPEVYGLPPDPRVCTADLPSMFKRAGLAAAGMVAAAALAFWKR